MGTWGTNITENDISSEIYQRYFDLYNKGQNPVDISAKLLLDYKELLKNPDDGNNLWFALALAQWETKSLDSSVLEKVKTIIESGDDIRLWRDLDADDSDVNKREEDLKKFLNKIQTKRVKAKPRLSQKHEKINPIFSVGDCLTFKHKNGNYGGIVILAANNDAETSFNLVAGTRINQINKPSVKDFENAEILIRDYAKWKDDPIIVWTYSDTFAENFFDFFELVGKIRVDKEYKPQDTSHGYAGDWGITKLAANFQFEHEKTNAKPARKITVLELTTNK